MIKYCFLTLGLLSFSACSSNNSDNNNVMGTVVKSKLSATIAARKAAKSSVKPASKKPFTMADATKVNAKLIRISVPAYKSSSLATQRATNNGYGTFATSGGQTVTLKGANVTATRGLRYDLVARSLGRGTRIYKHLNSLNHLTEQAFECEKQSVGNETVKILDRSFTLTKIEEVCRNSSFAFKNNTWVSSSGVPRKSQQWISEKIGHITIEWLN
jgi:uncharacterized protein YcfL